MQSDLSQQPVLWSKASQSPKVWQTFMNNKAVLSQM